jgi:phosphatidylglycerol lysyltransferase
MKAILQRLLPYFTVLLAGFAGWVIYREVAQYPIADIKNSLGSLSWPTLSAMVALTALSYLLLSLYDWLGLEYAGVPVPYSKVLMASFLSYALSNNVGHALVTGGSMRYRIYSAAGVPFAAIAKVILFCSATYLVAATTVLTFILPVVAWTVGLPANFAKFPVGLVTSIGAGVLLLWIGSIALYRKPMTFKGHIFELPTLSVAIKQLVAGVVDLCIASLVLYLPLHHATAVGYEVFLLTYISAQLMGLASQVPGGLGIFEASFVYLMPNPASSSHILAALLACRVIYYFLPFAFALIAMVLNEAGAHEK